MRSSFALPFIFIGALATDSGRKAFAEFDEVLHYAEPAELTDLGFLAIAARPIEVPGTEGFAKAADPIEVASPSDLPSGTIAQPAIPPTLLPTDQSESLVFAQTAPRLTIDPLSPEAPLSPEDWGAEPLIAHPAAAHSAQPASGPWGTCQPAARHRGLLGFGLVKHSDSCFDDFITPVTNPFYFEDPRTLTEVRGIYMRQQWPPVTSNHPAQIYSMQLRAALTEDFSLMVTKFGYLQMISDLGEFDSGAMDFGIGFKHTMYKDREAGRLLTGGMSVITPSGSQQALQGYGEGELNFFLSGATRVFERGHLMSVVGLRQPIDEAEQNRIVYSSAHYDWRVSPATWRPIYLFGETNWYYTASEPFAPVPPNFIFEGADLFNLGAKFTENNNLVTQALGFKIVPRRGLEMGIAYEIPVTPRTVMMTERWTADVIWRY
jgi:hypothetical protein